jgi:hypothetical protein
MLIRVPESPSKNAYEFKPAAQALLESLGMEEDWQRPEWPLPNMKKSTETEFWYYRSGYSFDSEAWAGNIQVDGKHATMILYGVTHGHLANGGFAVLFFYEYPLVDAHTEYYTFQKCDHEFNHQSTGNCQHRYTCTKCGNSYDEDSSG